MSAAAIIHWYLVANLLLVCAPLCLLLIDRLRMHLDWCSRLKLHYAALGAILLLATCLPYLPKNPSENFAVNWARVQFPRLVAKPSVASTTPQTIMPSPIRSVHSSWHLDLILSLIAAGMMLAFLAKIYVEICQLRRLREKAYELRRLAGVRIFASDEVDVPLCYWWPGDLSILIPSHLVGQANFRISILHELQHHRQGDTKSVYLLAALKMFFCVNPAVHLWNRWISALQEFACDSALVGHKKVETLDYATCLVQIAENLVGRRSLSAGAAARTFLTDRNTIQGRIQEMFNERKNKASRGAIVLALLLVGGFLSGTAYAARGGVDRHFTLADAQELLGQGGGSGSFPVVVNERVVKWLNIYAGTTDGRQRMSEALERMPTFKPGIEKSLKNYGLPSELLAIPLVESGYRNLQASANPVHAAGLWQFIASTAVNFGLQVDTSVDERLDVDKETDAALRLLYADKLRFADWDLSIMAYNSGEGWVQNEITKLGSRDAWTLIASGDGSAETNDYLPRLMAAILIMRNPSILN